MDYTQCFSASERCTKKYDWLTAKWCLTNPFKDFRIDAACGWRPYIYRCRNLLLEKKDRTIRLACLIEVVSRPDDCIWYQKIYWCQLRSNRGSGHVMKLFVIDGVIPSILETLQNILYRLRWRLQKIFEQKVTSDAFWWNVFGKTWVTLNVCSISWRDTLSEPVSIMPWCVPSADLNPAKSTWR